MSGSWCVMARLYPASEPTPCKGEDGKTRTYATEAEAERYAESYRKHASPHRPGGPIHYFAAAYTGQKPRTGKPAGSKPRAFARPPRGFI